MGSDILILSRGGIEMEFKTAESIGIKSEYIERFLDVIEENNIPLHSFMFMKDGVVGAEGYWKPFKADMPHRMYSVTKSFTAMAIGVLADEGKISLDDKIIKFFPDLVLDDVHPYIAETTIKNLLMMSTAYSKSTYSIKMKDWLKSYFTSIPDHPAGTIFNYDSCGSYVLGAIVKRVTGKPFMEYLGEKVLESIGFEKGRRCLEGPDGESWAGSGAIITTRELALFAQLLMNKGNFEGKQLISEKFVKEATTSQINNRIDGSDYNYFCGYGYQIWIMRDNAFHLNGMGGQLALGFPETGLIFVCTADVQAQNVRGKHVIYDALWNEVISKLGEDTPENEVADRRLKERCENLKLQVTDGENHSDFEKEVQNVTYRLYENPMGISEFKLTFKGEKGNFCYKNPRGEKVISFGMGEFTEEIFPEEHYPGERLLVPAGRGYKTANCAKWIEKDTLLIRVCTVDDFIGTLTIIISFKGDEVGIKMTNAAQFFFDEYEGFAGGIKA